jgi:hypothetical protein
VAQHFHEWLVGHAEVLVTSAGQDETTRLVHSAGQLDSQAGLADPGFTSQQCQPPFTRHRLLPEAQQACQFFVPTHENTSCAGEKGRHRDR